MVEPNKSEPALTAGTVCGLIDKGLIAVLREALAEANDKDAIEPYQYDLGKVRLALLEELCGLVESDRAKALRTLPGPCSIVKVHKDGDLSVECAGDELFLVTTEGKVFSQWPGVEI